MISSGPTAEPTNKPTNLSEKRGKHNVAQLQRQENKKGTRAFPGNKSQRSMEWIISLGKRKKRRKKERKDQRILLTKNFQETPQADPAQHRNRKVIIKAEEIDQFASRGHDTRDDAHHTERPRARYDAARGIAVRPAKETSDAIREKIETAREHECAFWVIGESPYTRDEVAPERGRGHYADKPSTQSPREALASAKAHCVSAVETAEGGRRGIAPAQQQDTHHSHVLGEEPEHDVCSEEVPDHTVVVVHFGFAHERA